MSNNNIIQEHLRLTTAAGCPNHQPKELACSEYYRRLVYQRLDTSKNFIPSKFSYSDAGGGALYPMGVDSSSMENTSATIASDAILDFDSKLDEQDGLIEDATPVQGFGQVLTTTTVSTPSETVLPVILNPGGLEQNVSFDPSDFSCTIQSIGSTFTCMVEACILLNPASTGSVKLEIGNVNTYSVIRPVAGKVTKIVLAYPITIDPTVSIPVRFNTYGVNLTIYAGSYLRVRKLSSVGLFIGISLP